ncbi:MAG: hypothetical protein GY752_01265 [bacterium]|nr:hypothetical protein [bacterium]
MADLTVLPQLAVLLIWMMSLAMMNLLALLGTQMVPLVSQKVVPDLAGMDLLDLQVLCSMELKML